MIRTAKKEDLDEIFEIYAIARAFMKGAGNPTQWGDNFPPEDLLREDVSCSRLYVCEDNGRLQGVFAFIPGTDPTYNVIDGAWLNDEPYAAVHRVASRGEVKGLVGTIMQWCMDRADNIRIDTHDDNIPMQKALAKNGFTKCGRITIEDGTPRVAYMKSKGEANGQN